MISRDDLLSIARSTAGIKSGYQREVDVCLQSQSVEELLQKGHVYIIIACYSNLCMELL